MLAFGQLPVGAAGTDTTGSAIRTLGVAESSGNGDAAVAALYLVPPCKLWLAKRPLQEQQRSLRGGINGNRRVFRRAASCLYFTPAC